MRYIAVNDNFDSMYTDGNELAPFKNLFNEWFARDTSKKIRAVKRAKAEKGERIGSRPPYGYVKDPNNKNHIIVDIIVCRRVRSEFLVHIKPCFEITGDLMPDFAVYLHKIMLF